MHWTIKLMAAAAALAGLSGCADRDVAAVPVVVAQPSPAPVVVRDYYEREVSDADLPEIPADADYYYHKRVMREVR